MKKITEILTLKCLTLMGILLLFIIILINFFNIQAFKEIKQKHIINLNYTIIKRLELSFENLAYTQGLAFVDNKTIIQCGGLYGNSTLRNLNFENLSLIKEVKLEKKYFGEGCDIIDGYIYQLTWREQKIFKYFAGNLTLKETILMSKDIKEGWGITHIINKNKEIEVFISNGSDEIFILDSITWRIKRILKVINDKGRPVYHLNELEMINGTLYCNVYLKNYIIAIDLNTGMIIKKIDFKEIIDEIKNTKVFINNKFDYSYCLNGIAYYEPENLLVITGKMWPYMYQIQII